MKGGCCGTQKRLLRNATHLIPLHRRGGHVADGVVPTQFLITNDNLNTRYPSLANVLGDIMLLFSNGQTPEELEFPSPDGHPSSGGN